MEEAFTKIFDDKTWGTNLDNRPSSGPGSMMRMAKPFTDWLQEFFPSKGVQTIVDIGCGDFQFMREFDLTGYTYYGIDCVEDIIRYNELKFGAGANKSNIHFLLRDSATDFLNLPNADVYIIKDVLQHWPTEYIDNFLNGVIAHKKCRFIVIVNCYSQETPDQDIKKIGDTRFLNAKMNPLKKFKPEIQTVYGSKQISVIEI